MCEEHHWLEQRLEQHGQLSKAQALRALRRRFLAMELGGPYEDVNHGMLSLLYYLSGKPLHNQWQETATLLELLYTARQASGHQLFVPPCLPDAAGGSIESEEDYEPWEESTATESDWGDVGGEEEEEEEVEVEEEGGSKEAAGQLRVSADPANKFPEPPSPPQGLQARGLWSAGPLEGPLPPVPQLIDRLQPCPPGSLLAQLYHLRLQGLHFHQPEAGMCYEERCLAARLMGVLQGNVPGGFRLEPSTGAITTAKGLHLPYLSPSALSALLRPVCLTGSFVRQLIQMSDSLANDQIWYGGSKVHKEGVPITPTMRAFGTAMRNQVQAVLEPIRQLEQELVFPIVEAPQVQGPGILLGAIASVTGVHRKVAFLHQTSQGAVRQLSGPPAQVSSQLLDSLYLQATHHQCVSGGDPDSVYPLALHLLLSSCLPLLGNLHIWLCEGWEDLDREEFFISKKPGDMNTHSALHEYVLRTRSSCCPSFLTPWASQILGAGHSLRFMTKYATRGGAQGLSGDGQLGRPLEPSSLSPVLSAHGPAAQLIPTGGTMLPEALVGGDRIGGAHMTHWVMSSVENMIYGGPVGTMKVQGATNVEDPMSLAPGALEANPPSLAQLMCLVGVRGLGGRGNKGAVCLGNTPLWVVLGEEKQDEEPGGHTGWNMMYGRLPATGDSSTSGTPPALSFSSDEVLSPAGLESVVLTSPTHGGGDEDSDRGSPHKEAPGGTGEGVFSPHLPSTTDTALQGVDAHPLVSDFNADFNGNSSFTNTDLEEEVPSLLQLHQQLTSRFTHAVDRNRAPTSSLMAPAPPELAKLWPLKETSNDPLAALLCCSPSPQVLDLLLSNPPHRHPPLAVLMDRAMGAVIQQRMAAIGEDLLRCLLSEGGLMSELTCVRNMVMMMAPAMKAWTDRLLAQLRVTPLDLMESYTLEQWLQECFSGAQRDHSLPQADALSVDINRETLAKVMKARAEDRKKRVAEDPTLDLPSVSSLTGVLDRSVQELEALEITWDLPWLANMVMGPEDVQAYNQVLVFLLQLRWARVALDRTRQRLWKHKTRQHYQGRISFTKIGLLRKSTSALTPPNIKGPPAPKSQYPKPAEHPLLPDSEELLGLHDMTHFVTHLQQYLMDRLLYGAWEQLNRDIAAARTLDAVRQCHRQYLAAIQQQCCQGKGEGVNATWRHLGLAIRKALDAILMFCNVEDLLMEQAEREAKQGAASRRKRPANSVSRVHLLGALKEFREIEGYMLRILTHKTIKIGGDAQLESLLLRLDFNEYHSKHHIGQVATAGG